MTQRNLWEGKTALVIGASMGGLLAARALADYYEYVMLVERDVFPAAGEQRKGTPQGRHAHAVLAQGLQIMAGYFPDLIERLIELGADYGDISEKARWHHEGNCHQPAHSGINAINISRPRLETEVRARVLSLENVHVLEGYDVLGLLSTPDNVRITGVRVIQRRAGSAEESLTADLVVDASGRGSRSAVWLEDLGYERPVEEAIKIGVTYVSCQYERRPEHIPGINAVIVAAAPENPCGGVLLSQEGGRWILTLAAYLGEQIPLDQIGFKEYARRVASPTFYEVVKDAKPVTEPTPYKIPSNLRRRYDRLTHFPDGYLVMGDALCSFNPIYGQGISVAAMEAQALHECLKRGNGRLAQRFFKEASKIIDMPWSIAVGNDLRFPAVKGPRTPMIRFINWYLDKLHHAAHCDAKVSMAFLKVVNLLAPPPIILQPNILWRVLAGNLRKARDHGAAHQNREAVPLDIG